MRRIYVYYTLLLSSFMYLMWCERGQYKRQDIHKYKNEKINDSRIFVNILHRFIVFNVFSENYL